MIKIRRNTLKLRNPETNKFEPIQTLINESGCLEKSVYDTNDNGVVDDAERLGGKLPEEYAPTSHTHTEYAPAIHSHEETDPTVEGWAKKDTEYKVTGNPVQVDNYQYMPMDIVTELLPKQDGSGDPYPAGGGKNLCPPLRGINTTNGAVFTPNADGSVTVSGTATAEAAVGTSQFVLKAGTYTVSGAPTGSALASYDIYVYKADGTGTIARSYGDLKQTFTLEADTSVALAMRVPAGTVDTTKVFWPMVESGSVATDFATYSNIRPISSYAALELNHSGKNLLNNIRYYDNTHTDIRAQYDNPLLLKAGVKYVLSTNFQADGLFFVDAAGSGSLEAPYLIKYQYDISSLEYTPTRDIGCIFVAIFNSGVPDGATIQLEVGAATSHEPYQGTLHTVQIGETVYGGRMDWSIGELTVEYGFYTFDGGLKPYDVEIIDAFSRMGFNGLPLKGIAYAGGTAYGAFSHGKYLMNWVERSSHAYVNDNVAIVTLPTSVVGSTVDSVTDYLTSQIEAGTPVQISYKLAEPFIIQLTPIQIKTLQGTNTFYGDGTITVSGDKNLHTLVSTVCKSVPTPTATDSEKFLRGDGTWATVDIPQSVITDTDPGAGVEVDYPDGTVIDVYE